VVSFRSIGPSRLGSMDRTNRLWRFYRVVRLLLQTLWVLTRERNRVMRAYSQGHYGVRPNVEVLRRVLRDFRETALALGGLMIKLGQFLSSRADLLPQEALAELADLQDEVPAEPFSGIRAVLERELGAPLERVFASIEAAPAGSASLGQVHAARLVDGQLVAVKVQRPGIERIVWVDLASLRFVLRIVRLVYPAVDQVVDTRRLFQEFSRVVYEELDYRQEGRSAERFARLFADAPDVATPKVLHQHSTHRVLTLSWMDGYKITDVAGQDAAGIDRHAVARRLVELYLTQILQYGYYHADPHPGNIFVRPAAGGGFQLGFVDFGMMGTITGTDRRQLTNAFAGVVGQDGHALVAALDGLGFIAASGANREALEQALTRLLTRYVGMTMGEVRDLDTGEIVEDMQSLLYGFQFRLPYQFAFLGRALGTLSGVATTLSPEFNFLEVALPYARDSLVTGGAASVLRFFGVESVEELGRVLAREGVALARSITSLPRLAERVLEHVERGDLRLIIDSPDLNVHTRSRFARPFALRALRRQVPLWVPLGAAVTTAGIITLWRRATAARGRR
jgi:predicted unusual protein kinase regulating ubiquinone biosynthesis (AarF/ABC1/UbiB family)